MLIIGAGPTGLCTLQCVLLHRPKQVIVCEKDAFRLDFVRKNYPSVTALPPESLLEYISANCPRGGADRVIEVGGTDETFRMAWQSARANAVVTIVALYDKAQILPLPDMYGKNLIFKTGGVDGCDCDKILKLIAEGKLDTTALITHTFSLSEIDKAYDIFENRKNGVIKTAIRP